MGLGIRIVTDTATMGILITEVVWIGEFQSAGVATTIRIGAGMTVIITHIGAMLMADIIRTTADITHIMEEEDIIQEIIITTETIRTIATMVTTMVVGVPLWETIHAEAIQIVIITTKIHEARKVITEIACLHEDTKAVQEIIAIVITAVVIKTTTTTIQLAVMKVVTIQTLQTQAVAIMKVILREVLTTQEAVGQEVAVQEVAAEDTEVQTDDKNVADFYN